MITDSSKDYLSGKVFIIFDGEEPTTEVVISYCEKNYGFTPKSIFIEPEHEGPFGMTNPGTAICHPNEGYFG